MIKRALAFITLILCTVISFAQNNSIWRTFDKNSVDTVAYRVTFTTQTPTLDKSTKNSKASEPTAKAFGSGPYPFSGGDGSAETPFLIGTPQDLINMSKAVNTKATYRRSGSNTDRYYYQANYKMIADIDMSEPYPGPFIMCEKTIKNNIDWVVNYDQIIQQTTASAPYTCPRVYLDTKTGQVSLASKTEEENCDNVSGNYKRYFRYYFYKESDMTYSALFTPIGTLAIQNDQRQLDQTNCVAFEGNFDGDGHVISNLEIIVESTAAGLFGYVSNAYTGGNRNNTVIKNVNLDNVTVSNASQTYSGGIAGSLSVGIVENCAVTNSNITGGYAGGGIVGRMVYPGSGSTPNGIVRNCQSLNNTITASNAGGIVGSNGNNFGLTQVENNIVAGNTVNGSNTGTFVSGVDDDHPSVDPSGNEDYTNRHITIISVRNELMIDGLIPDYCYIHSGISFDPKNTSDSNRLAKLVKELNGTEPITENIVLPNSSAIDEIIDNWRNNMDEDLNDAYGDEVVFTNTNSSGARDAKSEILRGNFYTYSGGKWNETPFTNDNSWYNKVCGYSITINGVEKIYRYYCYKNGNNYTWYFTDVENTNRNSNSDQLANSSHRFLYYYKGWSDYNASMKEPYKNAYNEKLNAQQKYYKLTATTPVVDITAGGGLFDKGNQLAGKTVEFRKRLNLQDWNLIGILPVNMNPVFNNKVNFLYNTDNSAASNAAVRTKHNDMAAVDFDYIKNNWNERYLVAQNNLPYAKGIFVWPYNTEWDYTTEEEESYTSIFTNNPILVQRGTVQEYYTNNSLSNTANTYIQSLRNTSTGDTYWFSLANPFTGHLNVNALLKNMTNNSPSLVSGQKVYVYRINSLGTGQWFEYLAAGSNNISAGDGFMIGLSGGNRSFADISNSNFGVNSMYGYSYVPTGDSSKIANSTTNINNETFHSSEFVCIDDGKNVTKLSATCQDYANDNLDNYDGRAMLSEEIIQPYFAIEGEKINHNHFFSLPYEAPLNIHAYKEGKVKISLIYPQKNNIEVSLIDMRGDDTVVTILNDASNIFLYTEKGENEGKYKIRFARRNNVAIEDIQTPEANISIWNDNKEINIYGKDLKEVEVVNTLGQRIYERKISGESYRFDLNTIAGAYIVRVKNSEGIKIEKIIIN